MPKLHKTIDYDKFQNDLHNRNVDNVKKLTDSMKKHGYIDAYPLHVVEVDGQLVIKDGGHRFHVAKSLGLPFTYVICEENNISIPEINNTQRRWSMRDYVESYIRAGKPDYVVLKRFSAEYGLQLLICANILYGDQAHNNNVHDAVKAGTFRVRNMSFAQAVADISIALRKITPLSINSQFLGAISKLCRVPEFDSARFIHKAKRLTNVLQPQATIDQYLDMCEKIYNDRVPVTSKVPLAFMARNASNERNFAMRVAGATKPKKLTSSN